MLLLGVMSLTPMFCVLCCVVQDVVTANPETWTFDPFTLKASELHSCMTAA
jgi:hypothetical protein